jgi:hypothetical protein
MFWKIITLVAKKHSLILKIRLHMHTVNILLVKSKCEKKIVPVHTKKA